MATPAPPTETTPLNPSAQPSANQDSAEPFFLSLNPSQPTTIIFLHGLTSSHLEWVHVLPLLSQYHLLVLDMPGHSRSSHIPGPYTIPHMADTIAAFIEKHAHGGVAHVVGMSMGAFVALDLSRRYPERCLSIFATGAHPYERSYAWIAAHPGIMTWVFWFVHTLTPDALYWKVVDWYGMKRHEELRGELKVNSARADVVTGVYTSVLHDMGWKEFKEMDKVRTLLVAGENGDDVVSAKGVAKVWKEEGIRESKGSRVAVIRGATHAWDLQMPELFAQGIQAWVEGSELPGGYEIVE